MSTLEIRSSLRKNAGAEIYICVYTEKQRKIERKRKREEESYQRERHGRKEDPVDPQEKYRKRTVHSENIGTRL